MNKGKEGKKSVKVPDTYVIIMLLLLVMAVLTYIIPAGVYDMVEDTAAGRMVVDSTSYHRVDRSPTTIVQFLKSIYSGLLNNNSMILFVMLIGGYFKIINETGAISNGLSYLIKKMEKRAFWVIPPITIFFVLLGATGVVINPVIAFIPIGLIVAEQLKLDRIAAVCMIYLGCYTGWGTSFMAPTSVQLAQKMAGIEPLSGFEFRLVVTFFVALCTIIFIMRYCKKVADDPKNSILYGTDAAGFDNSKSSNIESTFGARDAVILLLVVGGLGFYVWGAITRGWEQDMMVAIILAVAIIAGVIAKMTPDKIAAHFVAGLKEMAYGAILIGFASAITVIITDGKIIHTMIHAASIPMAQMPGVISAIFMYLVNLAFNFFIPSASGQAAVVMPLMAPLADVVGITRQVAVLAFQYGDGISNTIIPTSGVLMAALGVAGVPYDKWLKFMIPCFIMQTVLVAIAMAVAVIIGLA